jgi:hypothetical protein
MNAINKKIRWPDAILLLTLILSLWFYINMRQHQHSMNVNCSTILRYKHQNPDFIATLEMILRLDSNFRGQVFLSGHMYSERGTENVSRTILFDYEVNRPGEISVKNMHYVKNPRDTARDESFRHGFFYVPEGASRELGLNPLGNAWLIDNLQSPFALCVNKDN